MMATIVVKVNPNCRLEKLRMFERILVIHMPQTETPERTGFPSPDKRSRRKITRRDALKLSALGGLFAGLLGNEVTRLLIPRSFQKDVTPLPPILEKEVAKHDETLEREASVWASQLSKLEAIVSLFRTNDLRELQKKYFLKRFNLNKRFVESMANEKGRIPDGHDIGVIVKAKYLKTGMISKSGEPNKNDPDDLSYLTGIYMRDAEEWRKDIEKNNLEAHLVSLGRQGRRALIHTGFDFDDFDFQTKLVPSPPDKEKLSPVEGIDLIFENRRPEDVIVAIKSGEKKTVYQFIPDLPPERALMAEFIATHFQRIHEASEEDLQKLPTKEFELLQSWVYDQFIKVIAEGQNISIDQFVQTRLLHIEGFPTSDINKTPSRLNNLIANLSERLKAEGHIWDSSTKARQLVIDACQGDVSAFNELYSHLKPGDKVVFNTRSAHTISPRSYQAMLQDIFTKGASKEQIVKTLQKYAGNIFLIPIIDRVSANGDAVTAAKDKITQSRTTLAAELLSGTISLDEYASLMFGARKIIITDSEGVPKGSIISEKVCEPVPEMPPDVLDILSAVEGNPWPSGREYLQKFIGRNLMALLPEVPNSGGSDPSMQIIKQFFPSEYDNWTIVDKNQTPIFHHPEKYGIIYLRQLYNAILDEQPVPELYAIAEANAKAQNHSGGPIGQICAKLENYILARDFRNKFGNEKMLQMYAQYVPIGNARGGDPNAGGYEGGLQIHGLEAGSQYYYGKSLSELNKGEIITLVGMIQSPATYSPNKYGGGVWHNLDATAKERGLTALRICSDKGVVANKEYVAAQISNIRFTMSIPRSWHSDKPSAFAPDTFNNRLTFLGGGVACISEPTPREIPRKTADVQEVVVVERHHSSRLSQEIERTLDEKPLKLETTQRSEAVKILSSYWATIASLQYEEKMGRIQKKDFKDKLLQWCYQHNIDPNRSQSLLAGISTFSQAKVFQCGASAMLAHSILEQKLGIPPFGLSGVEGGVKNWVRSLGDKTSVVENGIQITNIDSLVNRREGYDSVEMLGSDYLSDLEVGDMIVSWRSMNNDYQDAGHVCIVVDKGRDSKGNTYIKVSDSNFDGNGNVRVQTVWADSFGDQIFPGNRSHTAVVRHVDLTKKRENSNNVSVYKSVIDQGSEVKSNDEIFGTKVLTAKIENRPVTLPGAKLGVLTENGFEDAILPAVSLVTFDKNGFVGGYDKTGLLENTPVPPGALLRPFLYAYLKLEGVIPGGESERNRNLYYYPDKVAIDTDEVIYNTGTLMMNMAVDAIYRISWRQALAAGFDVPFQRAIKEHLEKDPRNFGKLQQFLSIFGMELRDSKGKILTKPTPALALGRDAYVGHLNHLGMAISALMNPESHLDGSKESGLIEELRNTRDILLDDVTGSQSTIRDQVNVRGINPTRDEVGHDPFSPTVQNGTTSLDGDPPDLYIGSFMGNEIVGCVVSPTTNGRFNVSVARGRSDLGKSIKISNLGFLIAKASGAGGSGFVPLTRHANRQMLKEI